MNKIQSGLDTLKALHEEFRKSGRIEKLEAEHNAIMEKNKRHNQVAKENRVFEWMEKVYEQHDKWGEPRVREE